MFIGSSYPSRNMKCITCTVLITVAVFMVLTTCVQGDQCRDKLDRCARVRPQGNFKYEMGDRAVHQWVGDLLLIDPQDASSVCRDWQFYVSVMTCFRNRIKEYVCWSQSKYYWTDRYLPEEKTLRKAMEIFCDPQKRQEKINMNNCMLLNARQDREKEECLQQERETSMRRFGHTVSDNSMCSYFHKRLNCYRISFGAICKTSLMENTQVFNAITMDEYFDPLRKASICHIVESASGVTACLVLIMACLMSHWFL